MKKLLFILLFAPLSMWAQSFHYNKIFNGKDTTKEKGIFLIKDYGSAIEYTLFPSKEFGIDEFTNIILLVFDNRVFVRTKDLEYFKFFLDCDYFFKYDDKIVLKTPNRVFEFIR